MRTRRFLEKSSKRKEERSLKEGSGARGVVWGGWVGGGGWDGVVRGFWVVGRGVWFVIVLGVGDWILVGWRQSFFSPLSTKTKESAKEVCFTHPYQPEKHWSTIRKNRPSFAVHRRLREKFRRQGKEEGRRKAVQLKTGVRVVRTWGNCFVPITGSIHAHWKKEGTGKSEKKKLGGVKKAPVDCKAGRE